MSSNFFGIGKVKFTKEGGLAVRVLNATGAPSIKGYIVEASHSLDNGVAYAEGGDPDPLGIVYDGGVPNGDYIWVVISGIADVYYSDTVTNGSISRVSTVAEALSAGIAVNEALPVPPFASDKHFQEIGHPIQARTGAGLAKTILHFN